MRKIFLMMLCAPLLAGCYEVSSGERVGTVVKLSKRGYFCKTWEGQMLLGGLRKQTNLSSDGKSTTTSMVANTWDFTISDEKVLPAIQAALDSGDPIRLQYRQELVTFCRSDSDDYFVTGIK